MSRSHSGVSDSIVQEYSSVVFYRSLEGEIILRNLQELYSCSRIVIGVDVCRMKEFLM